MDDFATGYMAGQDSGGGNNGGMGGFWGDGLWAIIILAMLGFGRGGFGGFGGGDNGAGWATQADVRAAVDQQTLISKLDQQTYGLADSTYSLNNTLVNGFHGVDNAICNLGFQTQSGFNSLSRQMADCCCDIGRQIERGFCDTNANIAAQARGIIDYLNNEKIDSLRAENQALRFSASQDRQNAYITTAMQAQTNAIIDRIAPYPIPAFNVNAPYHMGACGCGCSC